MHISATESASYIKSFYESVEGRQVYHHSFTSFLHKHLEFELNNDEMVLPIEAYAKHIDVTVLGLDDPFEEDLGESEVHPALCETAAFKTSLEDNFLRDEVFHRKWWLD